MTETLAPFAVTEAVSQGRSHEDPPHPYRRPFERDRDRIIHSEAFRRLEGKTQVFMPGVDDNYRNRLTHSLEVAQIGRTVARTLGLNEALAEAICLGHDLGHSPFGHTGEAALNRLMEKNGGFEHNRQTVRIIDLLEHPYPRFRGLNLMYETRLGLAKHHGPYDESAEEGFPEMNGPLEGQIANVADRIAYNCHDLEDGLRAGLITEQQLRGMDLFVEAREKILALKIQDTTVRQTRTAKAIIDILVSDCIETSKKLIRRRKISSPAEVCEEKDFLIRISPKSQKALKTLEDFLYENMYRHPYLRQISAQTSEWITRVFEYFYHTPDKMKSFYRRLVEEQGLERTVCDYVSGMTDRYCLRILDTI